MHQFQPRVTRGVGGWEAGRGGGVGREEAKAPQVNIRGPELPTGGPGGPDRTTRLKGHHSSQGSNSRPIMPNWCAPQVSTGVNVSVMVLQGRKSSPQKSRPLESGHRRHGVWIAIEYSYKLGQEKEFKFLCVTGWFSQIRSHIIYDIDAPTM